MIKAAKAVNTTLKGVIFMTAVILSGGKGSEMKPLTCSEAKAMLEVCNVPLIEYAVKGLERSGFTRYIIAADRFSKSFADYFDDGRENIPCFSFSSSCEGTSYALEKAVTEWDVPENEPVIVLSGSTLCDCDYREMLSLHRQKGCEITVSVKKSRSSSGEITATEENGFLKSIEADRPKESCISDLVLTGTFIISGRICRKITAYGTDISTDVLDALLKENVEIGVYSEKGYCESLKEPEDLLKLNYDVLNGTYPHNLNKFTQENYSNAEITPPVCIGRNVEIADGAVIGSGTVLGDNVTVGKGAEIYGSVVGKGCFIGAGSSLKNAVIGDGAHISAEVQVKENAVVGKGAVIGEGAEICEGVRIWNGRRVEPFFRAERDLVSGRGKRVEIDEEGITGETNSVITPQLAAVTGSAAASLGKRIIFGCKDSSAAKALAMAFSSGVMSSGSEAWFLGEVTEPELSHCIKICGGSAGCYIEAGVNAKFRFFSSDGLPASSAEERIIEHGINKSGYRRSAYSGFGNMRYCPEIKSLYLDSLVNVLPSHLNGIKAIVNAPSKRISQLCSTLLDGLNDKDGNPVVFHISSDGTKISAYTEKTGYVFGEKLTLLCCKEEFSQGRNVLLPCDFPSAADILAEKYGCKVYRYSGTERPSEEASFARDGIKIMLKVLGILARRKITLEEACNELPEFGTVNRFVAVDVPCWQSADILRKLRCEKELSHNGVLIKEKRGRVTIRPVKAGRGVMMYAESFAMEAAGELCDFYSDMIKEQTAHEKEA